MSGEKPPVKRLGSLDEGSKAGPSKPKFLSGVAPRNFEKPAEAPIERPGPSNTTSLDSPDANTRRQQRQSRATRQHASRPPLPSAATVAFGGNIGAGSKTGAEKIKRKPEPTGDGGGGGGGGTGGSAAKTTRASSSSAKASTSKGKQPKSEAKEEDLDDADMLLLDESSEGEEDGLLPGDEPNAPIMLARLGGAKGPVPEDLAEKMEREPREFAEFMSELRHLAMPDAGNTTNMMLFQMPSKLPLPPAPKEEQTAGAGEDGAGQSTAAPLDRPASLEELKKTKLGKLLVFKSGRVKLQIGDVLFDVAPGAPVLMRQEVASIDTEARECAVIGRITQRVVVTPDVDCLLSDKPLPEFKRAAGANGAAAAGVVVRGGRVIDSESDDEKGDAMDIERQRPQTVPRKGIEKPAGGTAATANGNHLNSVGEVEIKMEVDDEGMGSPTGPFGGRGKDSRRPKS